MIPEEIISRYRSMDPNTEVVMMGKDLEDGLIVVMSEPGQRAEPKLDASSASEMYNILTRNRWCQVTGWTLHENDTRIAFIGVYWDNSQYFHDMPAHSGWVVKKYSISKEEQA